MLRRAFLSFASPLHGRARIQALLPQWSRYASVASSSAPPPPSSPPPPSPPRGPSRSGGGGPTVSSLNPAEVAKFASIAETWWDSSGPFKPLHVMNPTRLSFIRSTLCRHFRRDPNSSKPLEGLKVIDVGCGGGILSELVVSEIDLSAAISLQDVKLLALYLAGDKEYSHVQRSKMRASIERNVQLCGTRCIVLTAYAKCILF